jgi:uncharacterized membrane protein
VDPKPQTFINPAELSERTILLLIYGLYITGAITVIFGPTVGFIIAITQRNKMSTMFGKTHVNLQIKIFLRCFLLIMTGAFIAIGSVIINYYKLFQFSYEPIALVGILISLCSGILFLISAILGMLKSLDGRKA